ncbi:MAG: L,D-transpeptidase [Candidatus Krumholzibacteriia bacterium]
MELSRRKRLAAGLALAVPVVLFLVLVLGSAPGVPAGALEFPTNGVETRPGELARLERTLDGKRPWGVYIIVDTVANRLQVRRGEEVIREAVCSTGTGSVLEDPGTGQRWIFETPRGVRTVIGKRKDPVWVRPDWSFIEEGSDLPRNFKDRVDRETLGDWALDLGDGYMIHGTLFQRYLGRNVTHGCIRLGDEDLAFVAAATPVGASVLLF